MVMKISKPCGLQFKISETGSGPRGPGSNPTPLRYADCFACLSTPINHHMARRVILNRLHIRMLATFDIKAVASYLLLPKRLSMHCQ